MADQCPECEIIIITYAQIPARADETIHSCDAIEALYDTTFVQNRIMNHPELHTKALEISNRVLAREKQNNVDLATVIELLAH